jgi:hypothetical protein
MLWKLEQGFKKVNIQNQFDTLLTHHMCHRPWSGNIRVLPADIKQEIQSYYKGYKVKFSNYNNNIALQSSKILDSITKYMLASDDSDKLFEFINFTRSMDGIRKQNILDIVPEYANLFEDNLPHDD